MAASPDLDSLVERAGRGDRDALEAVVEAVRDDVYGLAVRMLWHPEDAEDATQEILIRIITNLAGFRGDSSFRTWAYRVAANHLLTTRKRRAERAELTFERFGRRLAEGLVEGPTWEEADAERRVLIEEVKIGCSQAMLLCLDRAHRLAYVLGEVLELTGPEAASVLEITPAAFRKRLSRARSRVEGFMKDHCGLVDRSNACRCHRRVEAAIEAGHFEPDMPMFARHRRRRGPGAAPPTSPGDPPGAPADPVLAGVQAVEELRAAAAGVQRSNPGYAAPEPLAARLRELLSSDRYRILRT